jgi:hypothetical protein
MEEEMVLPHVSGFDIYQITHGMSAFLYTTFVSTSS